MAFLVQLGFRYKRMLARCGLCLLLSISSASADGVEQRLDQAVVLTPRNPRAHLDLVDWHLTWNDTDKALSTLRYALQVDPDHAWRYHQREGDVLYDYRHDVKASKSLYRAALDGNPRARRSLLRYGSILIWEGQRAEADALFAEAVKSGLLRDAQQRPLEEFLAELTSENGPWIQSDSFLLLEDTMETLAHPKVVEIFQKEFVEWKQTHSTKDVLVSAASDPQSPGRHLQFFIHRPHFVDGVWRDVCALETPKICQALKSLNQSGVVKIHRASLEILESGAVARPQCHATNAELFVDVCLQAPEPSEEFGSPVFTAVGDETRPWAMGEVSVLDGSFEHLLANKAVGKSAVILRLVVRHPQLPCVSSSPSAAFEECGAKGVFGNIWRYLKRMIDGAPNDFGVNDDASEEL